jgi:hypothetical protein
VAGSYCAAQKNIARPTESARRDDKCYESGLVYRSSVLVPGDEINSYAVGILVSSNIQLVYLLLFSLVRNITLDLRNELLDIGDAHQIPKPGPITNSDEMA